MSTDLVISDDVNETILILVVEDHEDAADSTANLVRLYGHRVQVARTGGVALEIAADDSPDVVLLDIGLPDLDGWEVARWLREPAKGAKRGRFLVALKGCKSDSDFCRSTAAGIDVHLVKPVDPAVLVGVLRRFVRVIAPSSPERTSE